MYQKLLGLPINASAEGGGIDALNGWVHLMMAVLFVGWSLLFLFMLVRFRKGAHPRADHEGVKTHASSYVEVVIAVLEILLLVALSIPFWSRKVSAFPTEAEHPVHVVEGSPTNLKITTGADLALAEAVLKSRPKPKEKRPIHPFADEEMWK